jgi:hypothetical protein
MEHLLCGVEEKMAAVSEHQHAVTMRIAQRGDVGLRRDGVGDDQHRVERFTDREGW